MKRIIGGVLLLAFGVLLTAETVGGLGLAGRFGWLGLVNAKAGMVGGPVAIVLGLYQIVRGLSAKPARARR
jgi:hypothetical protein